MIDIDVNTILDQEKQQIEHVQKRIKRERERAKSALLSRPHGIIGQPYVALTLHNIPTRSARPLASTCATSRDQRQGPIIQ